MTFIETCSLLSPTDVPSIELINKPTRSSPSSIIYPLNDCLSFEYFDTIKNDFQSFIYVYFESYTISIYFADEHLEKKSLIVKHLEHMYRQKSEISPEINNNANSNTSPADQSLLPGPSITECILHTFDVNLIPSGTILPRDHVLIGPARLYFTTTDLYVASIHCNRADLKTTITNQCPSKDRPVLCIPYFTIKNYGNRSNIFLIELGKSNYGNGELYMKCQSSSLAGTVHLLVSPVIEERPLILSSAFQNQLLTNKRIEKSKNIHPPIPLSNDASNTNDSALSSANVQSVDGADIDARPTATRPSEVKSRLVTSFFRSLSRNVSNLRRSATFHNNNNNSSSHALSQAAPVTDFNVLSRSNLVAFNTKEKSFSDEQHQIILPESQVE